MRTTLHLLTTTVAFLCALRAGSQTYVFAQLQGIITMNTTGWNLNGSAAIGDTPGDIDPFNNELVLTSSHPEYKRRYFLWYADRPGHVYQVDGRV